MKKTKDKQRRLRFLCSINQPMLDKGNYDIDGNIKYWNLFKFRYQTAWHEIALLFKELNFTNDNVVKYWRKTYVKTLN